MTEVLTRTYEGVDELEGTGRWNGTSIPTRISIVEEVLCADNPKNDDRCVMYVTGCPVGLAFTIRKKNQPFYQYKCTRSHFVSADDVV